MSAPRFHPSAELLFDHARGALEPGRRLVVEAHIAACPACRAQVRAAEAVGGALLNQLPPAAMAPGALARALARIETPSPASRLRRAEPPHHPDWIHTPPEVLEAAAHRRRWAAPGVWVAPVTRDGKHGPRSYLLRVGPGMAVPLHTHKGAEFILVLKGAYRDGEAMHAAGDFAENDESVEHRPEIFGDEECVCLVATDGPLIPRDWVGRLFQPLVGI